MASSEIFQFSELPQFYPESFPVKSAGHVTWIKNGLTALLQHPNVFTTDEITQIDTIIAAPTEEKNRAGKPLEISTTLLVKIFRNTKPSMDEARKLIFDGMYADARTTIATFLSLFYHLQEQKHNLQFEDAQYFYGRLHVIDITERQLEVMQIITPLVESQITHRKNFNKVTRDLFEGVLLDWKDGSLDLAAKLTDVDQKGLLELRFVNGEYRTYFRQLPTIITAVRNKLI